MGGDSSGCLCSETMKRPAAGEPIPMRFIAGEAGTQSNILN